ncbi:invasion associated locus B family protein [Octadecabacter sp. R77987]|uniref:invasion associated locus B family protein n=1 Tax=Octadecabacter sp. R77987 TaxID=3093874 RepID=UPI00367305A5
MISAFSRVIGVTTALMIAGSVAAQEESGNRVAANTDWSVFVEDSPTECWGVSAPKETVNTRDGQPVAVRRGEILLFVFFRPGSGVQGQVTFTGGYPFAGGSTVEMDIGGSKFELFTEGEWAWPATPEDDAAIVAAMRRGAGATLTARSGRGTQTVDNFSLLGFTAAIEEAQRRCSS